MQSRAVGSAPTAASLIADGRLRLRRSAAIDHWRSAIAREDAEDLLAIALRVEVEALQRDAVIPRQAERRFWDYVERRASGEPVALIRGWVSFADLTLRVRPGVFVPRGSTEELARQAVVALGRRFPMVAVDVACGAGPVACAVAVARPTAEVWGLDIDPAAVALARSNARRHHLSNAHFRVSDLLANLPSRLRGKVGAISIHPPYVARADVRGLPREIRGFEPRHTLTDGSPDGLGLVRGLLDQAPEWLRRGGSVVVEVAPYLASPVQALMRRQGYEFSVTADPSRLTRVVRGRFRG